MANFANGIARSRRVTTPDAIATQAIGLQTESTLCHAALFPRELAILARRHGPVGADLDGPVTVRRWGEQRAEQYRCGGTSTVSEKASMTVLQVAYGVLEPYGIGLRYLAASKENSARRGFFQFHHGDLVGDTRRFASLLLPDPGESLALDVSVRTPPEARCRSKTQGLCIYQPSTIQIGFTFKDSPFIMANEIVPLGLERWTIKRNNHPDPDSARLSSVPAPDGFAVDFHPRRTGRYTLTAYFTVRDLPVKREYSLEVQVESAALVLGGSIDISDVLRALANQKSATTVPSPRISIVTSCLTKGPWCKLDLDWLQEAASDELKQYRVITTKQLTRWADRLRTQVSDADFNRKSDQAPRGLGPMGRVLRVPARVLEYVAQEAWRDALQSAIGDDEVRDGLRRMDTLGEAPIVWCEAIAASGRELFERTAGVSISREELVKWTYTCSRTLLSIANEAWTICPHRLRLMWGGLNVAPNRLPRGATGQECGAKSFGVLRRTRTNWLYFDESTPLLVGQKNWMRSGLSEISASKLRYSFEASLIPLDEDGVAADPIALSIDSKGGSNWVRVLAYIGGDRLNGAALVRGIHADISIYESIAPFVEFEWGDARYTRGGADLSPWCLSEAVRPSLCRALTIQFEWAATFDNSTNSYLASTFGGRISRWWSDGLLGLTGVGVSGWLRAGSKEVSGGLGIGIGLY